MKKITNFLEKFRNLKPSPGVVEDEIKKIINEICGLEDGDFQVFYKNFDLTVKTDSSVVKNEIFLKKEKILDELKKKLRKDMYIKIWFK